MMIGAATAEVSCDIDRCPNSLTVGRCDRTDFHALRSLLLATAVGAGWRFDGECVDRCPEHARAEVMTNG